MASAGDTAVTHTAAASSHAKILFFMETILCYVNFLYSYYVATN